MISSGFGLKCRRSNVRNLSYVFLEVKSGVDKSRRVVYVLGPIEEKRTGLYLCSKVSFATMTLFIVLEVFHQIVERVESRQVYHRGVLLNLLLIKVFGKIVKGSQFYYEVTSPFVMYWGRMKYYITFNKCKITKMRENDVDYDEQHIWKW